jgi:hypothetical protein
MNCQDIPVALVACGVLALSCTFGGACIGVWIARRDRAVGPPADPSPWPWPGPPPPPAAVPAPPPPTAAERVEAISLRVRQALAVDADRDGGIEVQPAVSALGDILARMLGNYAATLQPHEVADKTVRSETDEIHATAMRYCARERAAQITQAAQHAPQQTGRRERVH